VPVEISVAGGRLDSWLGGADDPPARTESEAELAARLPSAKSERLRALTPLTAATRAAAHAAGVTVLDGPVLGAGRLELRAYLREQAVSRVVHRYGTVMAPAEESGARA
jgi:RHH-type proline utilization regulon transcriptional repressor/proline dehydrogenase/delta 1-pyrroline-5-carboxylate dehydrogenase